jgi:hypothetical protein
MPGMGELMDGAVQQAPQPGRQFMACYTKNSCKINAVERNWVF